MKPFPAIESLQEAQTKHCECQCLPSKEIKRVPPAPENRRLLFIICKLFIYILQQKINKFFFLAFHFLPVIGLLQDVHLFANSSPKQLAQYGLSFLEANFCPARTHPQLVQRKHSRCHAWKKIHRFWKILVFIEKSEL